MKLFTVSSFAILLFSAIPVSAQALEDAFVKGDQLSYKGYEITRVWDSVASAPVVTIKRNGKLLARLRTVAPVVRKESTQFGLLRLLGSGTRQLIIEQYTGGAHCCFVYTIYDLFPRFRLIFSSKGYPVGDGFDELEPVDLDGDHIFELPQRIMTFDYYDGMAYVESPSPKVVFKYNRQKRKYEVANRKFPRYVLDHNEKRTREVMNDEFARFSTLLDAMLHDIYAGRAKQGWSFFDRQYSGSDKRRVKARINQTLRRCPVYISLYGGRATVR